MKEPAIQEANVFPARWVFALPEPTTLLCTGVSAAPGTVLFGSARVALARARRKGVPAFDAEEWSHLVGAVENSRGTLGHHLRWYRAKLASPGWRLTRAEAIGEVAEALLELGWSVGRVLRVIGVELIEVCVGHDVPEGLR